MSDSEGHIESPAAAADSPAASPPASPPADSPIADDDDAIASGDDLFGGGDDDDEGQLSDQPLSEHGLDSDDDQDQDGERYGEDSGRSARQQQQTREELLMDVDIFRHRTPKTADGNLQSLRIPPFIKMNPEEYNPDTFVPTDFDLENSLSKNPHSVARFRRDPETGAIQSNTTIYRWNDGSVTLAVGDEHFEVLTKGLADPENLTEKGGYQELQDAHYYAAAAHLSSSLLLTVGHVTAQYSVRANHTVADDALKRLTDRLQAATQGPEHSSNMIIRTVRDPELAKKEAELAEKERERAKRRRETAAARLDGSAPVGGRSGWGGGALSVGDLEGGGGGRRGGGRRKGGNGGGGARAKRRRDEYDSDDELPQGARRNDEYDKGDDFIAPSDDDLSDEEGGDDDDDEEEEEELDDDDDEDDRRGGSSSRRKRQKTAEAEDDDAEGDDDLPAARRNRRNVIDDDDDE